MGILYVAQCQVMKELAGFGHAFRGLKKSILFSDSR